MSSELMTLSVPGDNEYYVRNIVAEDIEELREWKNANRDSFFFKDIITPEMQGEWFRAYLQRRDDDMMVISSGGEKVGCIGFRRLEDRIDLYNLILGKGAGTGKGLMAKALDLVCLEARRRYAGLPVMVSVLRTNPALQWYYRRGFVVVHEHDTYLELERKA